MTIDQKRKKLAELDELYLDLLLDGLRQGNIDLKDSTQVKDYLKANQEVSEKVGSTLEDEVKDRLKEAEKRRAK